MALALLDSNTTSISIREVIILTSYQDPEETDTLYKEYKHNIDSALSTNFPNMIYKGIDDDDTFSFRESIALSNLLEFMNSVGRSSNGTFNAWVYNPEYLAFYNSLNIDKLHFLQVNVIEKEGELINQITLKSIDLKPSKNQSTLISKRKESTDYKAIENMLLEAIEVNTRYFEE